MESVRVVVGLSAGDKVVVSIGSSVEVGVVVEVDVGLGVTVGIGVGAADGVGVEVAVEVGEGGGVGEAATLAPDTIIPPSIPQMFSRLGTTEMRSLTKPRQRLETLIWTCSISHLLPNSVILILRRKLKA